MSTSERMNVPLSSLSLYLMICSLGEMPSLGCLDSADHAGSLIRASRAEIFGHPDRHTHIDVKPPPRDPKDLTSSRLQSELYCRSPYPGSSYSLALIAVSGAYQALRLCSFMSNPSVHTIQAQVCHATPSGDTSSNPCRS
jgi:hypothetical protein